MTMPTLTRTFMAPGEVFTGTPEEILAEIVHTQQDRVIGFIASRLARTDRHLAEDLAQETFLHLWRWHLQRGAVIDDRVFGLLSRIASQMICHHLRRRYSGETPVDLTDPAQRAARAAAAPSGDTPHLAVLFGDLESAKDALTVAAGRYRAAVRANTGALNGHRQALRPAAVQRCTERLQRTTAAAQKALDAFQAAADRVAEARAAWNGAAAQHAALVVAR
jgi:DNA-directed RNA polymerase specialized sigma24 family protein